MAEPALKLRSFTLTHPETGQQLTVEGERAPTQDEAYQLFVENPPPAEDQELPEGDMIDAVAEPAQALASGVAGAVSGGLQGIGDVIMDDAEAGAETVERVGEEYAEMGAPETQAGQRGLETVQDLIQSGIDLANIPLSHASGLFSYLANNRDVEKQQAMIKNVQEQGFGKAMGGATFDATESPILSTLAEMSPDLAETFLGLGAMRGAPAITRPTTLNPDVNPMAPARTAQGAEFKQKIADDIRAGSTDTSVARYVLDGAGKVKNDPFAVDAIKKGYDAGIVSAIKGASPVDRQKMRHMLEVMRGVKENTRFGIENRPSDVAGDSLMRRVQHVKDVNRRAGKELDNVAKDLRGNYASFEQPMNSFMEGLDEMGVTINPKTLKPVFDDSIIQGLPAPQKAIKNIVERLATAQRKGVTPDAYDMHMLKKYIDENVTYGGKGGEGLKGKTERILKRLRADIDGSLDGTFPAYDEINTTYAETRGALDAIQDTAGRKMDLAGGSADKATGTLLRRLMSNYSNRVQLYDAINQLNRASRNYGGDFQDDLLTQIMFADELDKVFGSVARTSLAGETGKAVKQGINTSKLGMAGDILEKGVNKFTDPSVEAQLKAMEDLLDNIDQ